MHIFFTDLDGTLLDNQSNIPKELKKAIEAYVSAGHILVLATGRPLGSVYDVIDRTGLHLPNILIIANNGSLIYDCEEKKSLLDLKMPIDDAVNLIDVIESYGIHAQTYSSKYVICKKHDPEIEFYSKRTGMTPKHDDNLRNLLDATPYKVLALELHDKEKLFKLQRDTVDYLGDKYISFFSCDQMLEFVDKRSGKGNAVKFVCEHFGISPKDAYAAGDAENDISMLAVVGHSIAIKNATDEVKAVASTITEKTNDEGGLTDILMMLSKDGI